MSYNLKRLGLALVAMLALGAVGASAASATAITSEKFTASQYPVTLEGASGAGVEEFFTEAGVTNCNTTYSATVNVSSGSLTITPEWSGCVWTGFIEPTVNENGCDFNFKLTTKGTFNGTSAFQAHMDIFECANSTGIQFILGTCEAWYEPQSNLTTVDIHSMSASDGSGRKDITFKPTVSNLAYEVTKDGFGCAFTGGLSTRSTGVYASSSYITIRGFAHAGSTGAQVDIDVG